MMPDRRRREAAWELLGALGWPERAGEALGVPVFGGIVYLLRDEFVTAAGAPLSSPRNAEPGPGTLTVTDTSNILSISSGEIVPGAVITGTNDPRVHGANTLARAAGRLFSTRIKQISALGGADGLSNIAWTTTPAGFATTNAFGIRTSLSNVWDAIDNGFVGLPTAFANDTYYKIDIVMRGTGGFVFVDGFLAWVITNFNFSNLVPFIGYNNATRKPLQIDYMRVRDLSAPFDSNYGIATVRDETLANGDTFVATANGIHDFEFTLPGSPSANDEIALNFRRQDASNKLRVIVKRNAGNTAWDFQVREVVAGTPATPSGWTDVTGVATPAQIRVIGNGSTLAFYTREGTSWTKRGNTITNTNFQSQAGLEIEAVAGTTLTAVTSYPRASSFYDVLALV